MNVLVTLLVPPYVDLTYEAACGFPEDFWVPGLRVAVPLGKGPLRPALVKKAGVTAPAGVKLRPVAWPLEEKALIGPKLLELLCAMADRQAVAHGLAISMLVPFVKDLRARVRRHEAAGQKGAGLAETTLDLKQCAALPDEKKRELAKEIVEGRARFVPPRVDAAASERVELCASPPWPIRPAAKRQREALEYLMFNGSTNRRTFLRALGEGSSQVAAALLRQGLICISCDDEDSERERMTESLIAPSKKASFELNEDQKRAVASINALVDTGQNGTRLLFGVTGSGKTAVYIEAARNCLTQGKSVLLLAPEVALAHKLKNDLRISLSGFDILFYNGYQSPTRREKAFRELARRQKPVLVAGTRSSLFLPIPNLGLVILDEEHDASFKQEERVPYHAKEAAWFRARLEKAALVLGSATPDIRTWHAASEGKIEVLRLPKRIAERPLPPVELVNMGRRRIISEEDTLLAPEVIRAIDETVARGEQAIVLLNRRGFSPLVYCPDCKVTLSCPNCAVGLSFHRDEGRLLCHYCGYSSPFPSPCPGCGNMNYMPMGEGTERTTTYLSARFGNEVLRFDRDSTRREGAMEELLARFARHEANILVGTQMLSKGHHFPDVTLAVVADGDLGLGLPDYRAAERTFQLLVQSSGRAGRGEKPGRVLIQTRDVNHYCWRYVKSADYEGFYAEELARRQRYRFPPFTNVSMIRFSHERNDAAASEAMLEVERWLKNEARARGLSLLGPVSSPIPVINNRARLQCLLKTNDWSSARRLFHDLTGFPPSEKVHPVLNLDPYSML